MGGRGHYMPLWLRRVKVKQETAAERKKTKEGKEKKTKNRRCLEYIRFIGSQTSNAE